MIKKFLSPLLIAGIVTLIFGVIYAGVQSDIRQSANDPQIQIAEDTASYLNSGGDVTELADEYTDVDFSESSPFLIVYDAQGDPLLSTGTIMGDVPPLPLGVLTYTGQHGEDRITWQPESNARVAIVVVPYTANGMSGYVLAGRSLREVEKREWSLEGVVFAGWALSMFGLIVLFVWIRYTDINGTSVSKV